MLQLLVAPALMNKKPVQLVGYLDWESSSCVDCGSGAQLCLHKEDAERRLADNCVRVDLPHPEKLSALAYQYVLLQGKISVERYGKSIHVSIVDVRFVTPIPTKEQWEAGARVQVQ
jgi:hypothetical protein